MRLLAALAVVLAAGPAVGQGMTRTQPTCLPTADMRDRLAIVFGEYPAVWLIEDGSLVELLITPDGSTWSLVRHRGDGTACLIHDGDGWSRPYPPMFGPEG